MSSIDTMKNLRSRRQRHPDPVEPRAIDPLRSHPVNNPSFIAFADASKVPRTKVLSEVEDYAIDAYLREFYGDFVSTKRTRIYEPRYPPLKQARMKSPQLPNDIDLGSQILDQALRPVIGWYCHVPRTGQLSTADQFMQGKIGRALERYYVERRTRLEGRKTLGQGLLYRNLPDAVAEINVSMLINRVHIHVQRGSLVTAGNLIDRAIDLVKSLTYAPVIGRCHLWKAVIAHRGGDTQNVAPALVESLSCIGRYPEGETVPELVVRYKTEVLDLLEDECARRGVTGLSRRDCARELFAALGGKVPLFSISSKRSRQRAHVLTLTSPIVDAFNGQDLDGMPRTALKESDLTSSGSISSSADSLTGDWSYSTTDGSFVQFPSDKNQNPGPLPKVLDVLVARTANESSKLADSDIRRSIDWEEEFAALGFRTIVPQSRTRTEDTHSSAKPQPLKFGRPEASDHGAGDGIPDVAPLTSLTSKSSLFQRLYSEVKQPQTPKPLPEPALRQEHHSQGSGENTFEDPVDQRDMIQDLLDNMALATETEWNDPNSKLANYRNKLRRIAKGKVDQVGLREFIERQRCSRVGKIQTKFEKMRKHGIGMKAVIGTIRRDELRDLRQRFGKRLSDPYEEDYKDLRNMLLAREREERRKLEEAPAERPQEMRSAPLVAEGLPSNQQRRKSAPEVVLSDTPAVTGVKIHEPRNPFSVSSIKFGDRLGGNTVVQRVLPRKMSIPESPTQPVSPSPLRKASVPGDFDDHEDE